MTVLQEITPLRIVTVSGLIGSGKTSVCRELSALTGWKVISAGTILRRMAEERGISLLELNEIAKRDDRIDKMIDSHLIALRESPESLIVDSRLAWHFIPSSYKIHLVVDKSIAAERVFRAQRSDEHYLTPEDAYAANARRQAMENDRFQHYYQIDCDDWGNYDFVLDSGTLWPDALAQLMHDAAVGGGAQANCLLAPRSLEPSSRVDEGPVEVEVVGHSIRVVSGQAVVNRALVNGLPLLPCHLCRYAVA